MQLSRTDIELPESSSLDLLMFDLAGFMIIRFVSGETHKKFTVH